MSRNNVLLGVSPPAEGLTPDDIADRAADTTQYYMNLILSQRVFSKFNELDPKEEVTDKERAAVYIHVTFEALTYEQVEQKLAERDANKPAHEHLQETPVDGH